jgi:hypothetical protein
MSTWTGSAERTIVKDKDSVATRNMVVFEVLDSDSRSRALINENGVDRYVDVVALIYKRVALTHAQNRAYDLSFDNPDETNIKNIYLDTRPLWELDLTPATDKYACSGTRTIEYKLCLIVGSTKYVVVLGTVRIDVGASFDIAGNESAMKQDAGTVTEQAPTFIITGDRLYGVSVNCGKEACTWSYDREVYKNGFYMAIDSPVNVEDYNAYWEKAARVVGAINYHGVSDSKEFVYGADFDLPDKVMAVGYKEAV